MTDIWRRTDKVNSDIDSWCLQVRHSDTRKACNVASKDSDLYNFYWEDTEWVLQRQNLREQGRELKHAVERLPKAGEPGVTDGYLEIAQQLRNALRDVANDVAQYPKQESGQ